MIMSADKQPSGAPFVIGEAVVQVLKNALPGATVVDNPSRLEDLQGDRVVFFEDQGDKPSPAGKPGQLPYRLYTFAVGVISRAFEGHRLAAHSDYRTAKRALRIDAMRAITAAGISIGNSGLAEGDVRYRVENIDVGGSLVLGLFTIEYRDPT